MLKDLQILKYCHNCEKCANPNGPRLPLSEFYPDKRAKDGLMQTCKECCKKHSRETRVQYKLKTLAWHSSEKLAIAILLKNGIFACPGKSSVFKRVDVAVWGCIRLEVKSSSETMEGFSFGLGHKDKYEYERSDLVMLIPKWDDREPTYHIFRSNDSVFYHQTGKTKTAIGYPIHRKVFKPGSLTDEQMAEHENLWSLIEEVRLEKIQVMIDANKESAIY